LEVGSVLEVFNSQLMLC